MSLKAEIVSESRSGKSQALAKGSAATQKVVAGRLTSLLLKLYFGKDENSDSDENQQKQSRQHNWEQV